ncbi:MAG: RNA polymerase factor sigma-54 [Minwuiales bacterium]|nr:RNA polymerase factor sigma-54 [Minwuiales bacterium]
MAITPRLELRQSQALVMTPQLQQAIKLLQLSNLELGDYVERELERNPLLERDESGPAEGAAPEAGQTEPGKAADSVDTSDLVATELKIKDDGASSADAEASLDADYASVYSEDSASDAAADFAGSGGGEPPAGPYRENGGSSRFEDPDFSLENTLTEAVSLKDHLTAQIPGSLLEPVDRMIGAYLIDSIDEAGYLMEPLDHIAQRLGCETADVARTLKQIQTFDPPGVFARDLAECLALQLRELDRLDPAMQALLDNLDKVAARDVSGLMKICGVDSDDITDMVAEIKALNPKPGLAYGTETVQTVVPDVFIREDPEGGWLVELNSETLPRVLVNNRYYAKVTKESRNPEERSYLTDCLHSANWLVKSLSQRANTILRVSSEIVRQQDGFFAHGVQHLRPLNLRTIAEAIEMHESTVSRVTANKYMATPRGIFELKYFFTSAIASSDGGEAHSAEAVRHRIKELIDAERPGMVLSDDKLVELLRKEDIDIARRTVAKYREALGIPSSVQRRREKKLLA